MAVPIVMTAGGPSPRMLAMMSPEQRQALLAQSQAQAAPQAPRAPEANMALADALLARSQRPAPMHTGTELLGRLAAFGVGTHLKRKEERAQATEADERRKKLIDVLGGDPRLVAAMELGIESPEVLRGMGILPPQASDASKAVSATTETLELPDGEKVLAEVKRNADGGVVDYQVLAKPGQVNINTGPNIDRLQQESAARAAGGIQGRSDTVRAAALPERNASISQMEAALEGDFSTGNATRYEAARRKFATFEAQRRLPGEAVTDDSIRQVLQSVPGYTAAKAASTFGMDPLRSALEGMGSVQSEAAESGGAAESGKPVWEMTDEEIEAELKRLERANR